MTCHPPEISNICKSISNFHRPNAKETLRLLTNIPKDQFNKYPDICLLCGGPHKIDIFNAFERADLNSLKFMVEEHIINPDILCTILVKLFTHVGSNQTHKYPNMSVKRIDHVIVNIEYLLEYLCKEYPKFVIDWRYDNGDQCFSGGSLLHHVFCGYEVKHNVWASKLLDIGCDPFAFYSSDNRETPFHYMLLYNHCDLAEEMIRYEQTPDFEDLINYINKHSCENWNILQRILFTSRKYKKPEWIDNLKLTVYKVMGLGINLNHIDSASCTVTDFIILYGYSNLLADVLGWNLPKPNINARDVFDDDGCPPNPSPYTAFFHKYRYAKAKTEIDAMLTEYERLKTTIGPLTKEQLTDDGHRPDVYYTPLLDMIIDGYFYHVIPELINILK